MQTKIEQSSNPQETKVRVLTKQLTLDEQKSDLLRFLHGKSKQKAGGKFFRVFWPAPVVKQTGVRTSTLWGKSIRELGLYLIEKNRPFHDIRELA